MFLDQRRPGGSGIRIRNGVLGHLVPGNVQHDVVVTVVGEHHVQDFQVLVCRLHEPAESGVCPDDGGVGVLGE